MFTDREQAGKLLAKKLGNKLWDKDNTIVLALPRGGVPVAYEVAQALSLPLDIFCIKKIGHPNNSEVAIGAISEFGDIYFNAYADEFDEEQREKLQQLAFQKAKDQANRLRGKQAVANIKNKDVIVVDDGIATGATTKVAIMLMRKLKAKSITLAIPVAPSSTITKLQPGVDEIICLETPHYFSSVGQFYRHFRQISDEEVTKILAQVSKQRIKMKKISIIEGRVELEGHLTCVDNAQAWVIFVHGCGSSHLSTRNNWVAEQFNQANFSTLLFDLLTPREDYVYDNRFNTSLLSSRLMMATDWLMHSEYYKANTPIIYYGASTGAAAALEVAARRSGYYPIKGVVSRGGRPDLAKDALDNVDVPVLLIVGGHDEQVIELNELAQKKLSNSKLQIVTGATHLFEEPGALDKVAQISIDWMQKELETKKARVKRYPEVTDRQSWPMI